MTKLRQAAMILLLMLLFEGHASATIFGTVHGVIRDAQRRPLAGAAVTLQARSAQWRRTATTGADGVFSFAAVPLGDYELRAGASGMGRRIRAITVNSGTVIDADLDLPVATVSEEVQVSAAAPTVDPHSSTTRTTVSRLTISQTPGADQANSMAMITNIVPGSYMVHDQLHVRGGHQVDWLIDGVPVPNTNIASNVGPQFDPKDVDYLEVQRGGYSAEYGDRTYGVFNVVPRSGFERKNEADITLGAGSRRSTSDRISLGSHTDRFAYYGSLRVDRSDYGLETPVARVIHDGQRGEGGFVSLIFQQSPADQFRMAASARTDRYQIPNDEDAEATGVSDHEHERDAFVNLSWLHVFDSSALLTVAPFFHTNTAGFDGGSNDPIVATDHRTSRYTGAQVTFAVMGHGHDGRMGAFGFAQQDAASFGLRAKDGSDALFERETPHGNLQALFAEDGYALTSWLTARAGLRYTRFSGDLHETATSPRAGLSVRLPWSNAVLRASYGQYYQAPPLSTVSGPLLAFALQQGFGFLPLHGERDRQAEVGIGVPVAGWTLDAAAFRTSARNFFDHDVLGSSNIFFPLTIDRVHIRGLEATVVSPSIAKRADLRVAYSHQTVEGEGGVVGGLTDFSPPPDGRFFLDHDQRDTLSVGGTLHLPRASWLGINMAYGSGFLQGNGPGHLPGHTTFDVVAGTTIASWSVKLTVLNVTNKQYLLDQSNTFGGTHYVAPRQVTAQVGYRFHY